jgi:hypothetical protein
MVTPEVSTFGAELPRVDSHEIYMGFSLAMAVFDKVNQEIAQHMIGQGPSPNGFFS